MLRIILNNFLFTLSTFTQIRTVDIRFDSSNTKYTYAFLPIIGIIVGALSYLCLVVVLYFSELPWIAALLMIVCNIIITGGIHHDGLLDSLDAFKSYRNKEDKKRIIKDPCVGAFALIYFIVVIILMLCAYYYIIESGMYVVFFVIPIISRTLLLFLIVNNDLEKDDMLEVLMDDSLRKIIYPLSITCLLITLFVLSSMSLLVLWIASLMYLIYYNGYFKKHFDALNGDLCGYYIITCELVCSIVAVILL